MQASFKPSVSEEERYRRIQKELVPLNLEPNDMFTKDQFFMVLDSRLQDKQFDRNIALELFDRMKKETKEHVLVDQFIRVYLEAVDHLSDNLAQANQFLKEYNEARLDAVNKLEELRHEEILSKFGIMEGSVLALQVLELKDLDPYFNKDVYVTISCGDSQMVSKVLKYSGFVQWHEQFNVEIKTGKESVHIQVVTLDNNREFLLGKMVFPIGSFKDQLFRDEVFELQDSQGRIVPGKLHLKLQWIHSRVKYLESVIKVWEKKTKVLWDDKNYFEQTLTSLKQIFPNLAI